MASKIVKGVGALSIRIGFLSFFGAHNCGFVSVTDGFGIRLLLYSQQGDIITSQHLDPYIGHERSEQHTSFP